MRLIMLVLFVCFNLLAVEDRQELMDSISSYAIKFGDGPNRYYTFVDPLCPNSKAFISLIDTRKDLQKKNSYYIFLYPLAQFNSEKYIEYIYQSQDKEDALKEIMIYEDFDGLEDFSLKQETLSIIQEVSKVAKELNMKRRPYILIFDEGSNYCRVSEGTAPCLEENDFEN